MSGQIHVYTGDGKGKTTAAFGLALRALGRGKKVAIIQFMKPKPSGEIVALSHMAEFKDKLYLKSYGENELIRKATQADTEEAEKALLEAKKVLKKDFDLVVLDEINMAVAFGLIGIKPVIKMIETKPIGTNIVLTGRRAHLKMMEVADLVTEMRKIKHPHDKGGKAKVGLEY
jgi:cob(I)alamin adenosyltransferase